MAFTDMESRDESAPSSKFNEVLWDNFVQLGAGSPNTRTGAGAVPLTSGICYIATDGADALTLADGSEGQHLYLIMTTDSGDGTLTPASLGNGTTITFDDVGDTAHLLFTGSAWYMLGGTATLA